MSSKIVLLIVATLTIGCVTVCQAQQISPNRARNLYVEYDRTQSCPNCNHELPCMDLYGFKGQPYRDKGPGGCECGKKKGITWYNGYHHWPSPWSVLIDHGRDGCIWGCGTDTTAGRLRDKLDIFANVRLSGPVRKDNGYCGPHCEPYGLVGKSRRGIVLGEETEQEVTNTPGIMSNAPLWPAQDQVGQYQPGQQLRNQQFRNQQTRIQQPPRIVPAVTQQSAPRHSQPANSAIRYPMTALPKTTNGNRYQQASQIWGKQTQDSIRR